MSKGKVIIKLIIAFVGILICIVIGLFIAYTYLPPTNGRDFRLAAIIVGILIALFSTLLRAKYQWNLSSLFISLIPVELLTMFIIMMGSGSFSIVDTFNLKWLLGLNRYIALPWIIGIIIGSGFIKLKGYRLKKNIM